MKKLMCLITLALVFSTSVPLAFAQANPPIIVGGGGRAASLKERAQSQSIVTALTVQVILTLIQAGVTR
jgi:outer membrane receptor protein involved in Fe transport